MKIKLMKKMVATLCATVVTTSCLTSSVGAIKPSDILKGFNEETREHVNEINDRVSDLDWNMSTTIKNVDKVIDRVKQIVKKQGKTIGGVKDDTYEALSDLKNIKKSLTDTYNLKLCHDKIVDIFEKSLRSIDWHINYMLGADIDNLVYCILGEYNTLTTNTRVMEKGLQFSTELDDKRFALHKAGVFIKKMNDSVEKSNLKKQYDEAQNYYDSIIRTVTYANKSGREQAQRFFDLADKAINEVNKVRDARGDNVRNRDELPAPVVVGRVENKKKLSVPVMVENKNELPAPVARENKNNNKPNKIQELIAKFDKQKQDKAKLEKARKDVERQLKKMDERIKKEREEQKRKEKDKKDRKRNVLRKKKN